jgi:chaperonin GroES
MSFKPLGNRVLVQIPEEKSKTNSGIFLPETASKEAPTQAVVVAISDEVKNIELNDTVVYAKYVGAELNIDGIEYLVLEDKDILGVIK